MLKISHIKKVQKVWKIAVTYMIQIEKSYANS